MNAGTTLLKIAIDRTSGVPLRWQVCEFLRGAIVNGRIRPGMRLPSTRALALRLRVSRNTVLNAYETLLAEGLLSGQVGSGTRVRDGLAIPPPNNLRPGTLLRRAHYPAQPASFEDPDGNLLYSHR